VVHIVLKHVTHLVEICEGIYAGWLKIFMFLLMPV
jgi:hypothetical protein